ncbi:MAG: WGR domain-containing protein [Desulfobacterales bacterium]|nr:WGR domain-containing protein [Desulfobacterales bacterium]
MEFKDEKSEKFWHIEADGTGFTTTYGKIGKSGTSSSKEFDSEEKCLKEAEKLIKQKMKKGYGEKNE